MGAAQAPAILAGPVEVDSEVVGEVQREVEVWEAAEVTGRRHRSVRKLHRPSWMSRDSTWRRSTWGIAQGGSTVADGCQASRPSLL